MVYHVVNTLYRNTGNSMSGLEVQQVFDAVLVVVKQEMVCCLVDFAFLG